VFVRKECVKGEIAVDEEASPVMCEVATVMEDVPEIVEAAAVRACGVIRGSGMMAEGIIALEGVSCDYLKGGALEAS
jgi:hypothetical protein